MSTIPSPLTAREIEALKYASTPEPTAWWPSTTTGGGGAASGSFIISGRAGGTATFAGLNTNRHKLVGELVDDGYWVKMTGSRVTKDGWTDESDWDYVVYDPDKKLGLVFKEGWVMGSEVDNGEFLSIKKDGINLILVDKEEIWKKYIIATNLIKTLNSKTKGERIAVFDSVFGKDKNAAAVDFGVPF